MGALAGLVLTGLEQSSPATSDAIGNVGAEAGAIAYAVLGALIVRRAGNLVGWFMLAEGAATAVMTTGSAYAILGVKAGRPALRITKTSDAACMQDAVSGWPTAASRRFRGGKHFTERD
jgi:hypothetical protein